MCYEKKWRFPLSGHAKTKGLSSGDSETFKKNPYQAFAREILQNSVDARDSDEDPVRVEFHTFDINVSNLPGAEELKEAISNCQKFWKSNEEYAGFFKKQLNVIRQPIIKCLRISDYNTTGLTGVDDIVNNDNNKFLALTKSTGVSQKNDSMSGGSKGVGKNAAFLLSSLNTIFYSTNANSNLNGERSSFVGYIGVAEFPSGCVQDSDDYTQGTGYFSLTDKNDPIRETLELDQSQKSRKNHSGTDIYILGFKEENDWDIKVITSVLDSFMAAIVRGHLEVAVENREISKDTLGNIIHDPIIISENQISKNIMAQYRLLTDDEEITQPTPIELDYGECELRVLVYNKNDSKWATNKCSILRHPLMKIKDISVGNGFNVSALCIIPEGKMGKILRNIENPKHDDWELNRIEDKSERQEISDLIKDMRNHIIEKIQNRLKISPEDSIDPNGAGEFLPDIDVGNNKVEAKNKLPDGNVSFSSMKENVYIETNSRVENKNGNGIEPDIGDVDQTQEGSVLFPTGSNSSDTNERHPGSEMGGLRPGDKIIFKKSELSGVRYKILPIDKNNGKYKIIFIAPQDSNSCYLKMVILDDINNKTSIDINSLKCNGIPILCEDKKEFGPFSIKLNQKIVLEVELNVKGYFGSEVKIICK